MRPHRVRSRNVREGDILQPRNKIKAEKKRGRRRVGESCEASMAIVFRLPECRNLNGTTDGTCAAGGRGWGYDSRVLVRSRHGPGTRALGRGVATPATTGHRLQDRPQRRCCCASRQPSARHTISGVADAGVTIGPSLPGSRRG